LRKNLIQARTVKELTQVELSKLIGTSERNYQYIEAGTSNGSLSLWKKLSKVLGQSIDTLLTETNDTNKL
jgi:DNA-binding XRE family transcriptional regulator